MSFNVKLIQLMWAIVTNNFKHIISTCDLKSWKEALAVILTYTAGEEFTALCSKFGYSICTNTLRCLILA